MFELSSIVLPAHSVVIKLKLNYGFDEKFYFKSLSKVSRAVNAKTSVNITIFVIFRLLVKILISVFECKRIFDLIRCVCHNEKNSSKREIGKQNSYFFFLNTVVNATKYNKSLDLPDSSKDPSSLIKL